MTKQIFEKFFSFPWLIVGPILLALSAWSASPFQAYPLINLVIWFFGVVALTVPVTMLVDKTLGPNTTPERLEKDHNIKELDHPLMIFAYARRFVVFIGLVIALAIGI